MRAVALLGFAVLIGCGKPGEPAPPARPAAFDANDAEQTFEWAVALWNRARDSAPKGNTAALIAERERSGKEFAGIAGKAVNWSMRAKGVAGDGLCRVGPLVANLDGSEHLFAVMAKGVRTNDTGFFVTLFPFSRPERAKTVGAGDRVTVRGTVTLAELRVGGTLDGRGELHAVVTLENATID